MKTKYEVVGEISATIMHAAHPLLGFEAITQIEFFGIGMSAVMKQVLLVPYEMSVPQHLRNENVITYRVPADYMLRRLVFAEGEIGGRKMTMVQIFYTTGEEEHHHDHVLLD